MTQTRGYHLCPCGCAGSVPDRLFACRDGWARLPLDIRAAILRTQRQPLTNEQRFAAVADAVDFYRNHHRRTP